MPKDKKDPNAPTLIPEDTFLRLKKLVELKIAPKQPKGEFTSEEWCIPPAFHSLPEFKTVIHYWQQCAIVQYTERDMKVPSRMKVIQDDAKAVKKPHPRKEIQDLFKYAKTQVKAATKRTGQFLKQLEKKEAKEAKREKLLQQINDVDKQMNEELRNARKFIEKQQLFDEAYMVGTKLGKVGPKKNALIIIEQSDKQAAWIEETKDEVSKLLNGVINEGETENFNVALFSGSAVTAWSPQFQAKTDPKKGLADSLKWLNKSFSAKTCGAQPFPPDWVAMLSKFTGEGQAPPWRIFLCCSRSPGGANEDVLKFVQGVRADFGEPAKGQPALPFNVVAFDPSIVGNEEEKAFFEELVGPSGSFMIDTSAEDLVSLDKALKAVQVKKKSLDKLHKKLDKMEDLSERVIEDRSLLQMQIALNNMLQSDLEVCDWALKFVPQATPPEI
mmetsp:Transcript_47647/g.94308  ORF Transcript_47647/g.94308 Transcript_47647/m.94308 type:complete len:443 (-) Transcript_47647:48-1376(-)